MNNNARKISKCSKKYNMDKTKQKYFVFQEKLNEIMGLKCHLLEKKIICICNNLKKITTFDPWLYIVKMNNANLIGFACIIDRSNNNLSIKDKMVSQMSISLETFDKNNLPENLKKIKALKPGSRNLSKWPKLAKLPNFPKLSKLSELSEL